MTGYVLAWGRCFGCKRIMSFNPDKVPSIRINGEREPVCRGCIEEANRRRIANGLDPVLIDPDAYEAAPEEECVF